MKTVLFAGLAMAAGLSAAGGAAAQDDDWEFQEDATRNIAVAAVRYDAGQMIVVQCREGGLTAVVTGLPVSEAPLDVTSTRADGRQARQTWRSAGAPGAYQAVAAGHAVRFLRGGGMWTVQSREGATPVRAAFDLPTQFANLDRVLNACGWAVTDDRDQLGDATEIISLSDPDASPPRRRPRQSRSVSEGRRPSAPPGPVAPPAPLPSEYQVSCIVREMRLRDCRADHPGSAQARDVTTTIRFHEGEKVYPIEGVDPAPAEGRVVRLIGGRVVIIDYLATLPG